MSNVIHQENALYFLTISPAMIVAGLTSQEPAMGIAFLIATIITLVVLFSKIQKALRNKTFRNIIIFDLVVFNSLMFATELDVGHDDYLAAIIFFGFIPCLIISGLWRHSSKNYQEAIKPFKVRSKYRN